MEGPLIVRIAEDGETLVMTPEAAMADIEARTRYDQSRTWSRTSDPHDYRFEPWWP